MKTIVVTGNTQGIGLGLTHEFLKAGCRVMISSRRSEKVDQVVEELAKEYTPQQVAGIQCDVTDPADVQALWQAALDAFAMTQGGIRS